MILHTPRLRLEPVQDSHFEGLLALLSDLQVMRFFEGPRTEKEVRAWIDAVRGRWEMFGFGWWAAIAPGSDKLVGAVSTQHLENDASKPIEVGWRLRSEHWGKGFATEAGQAMLRFAFEQVDAPEVYAVAHPANQASLRVMQRLGMRDAGLQWFYGKMCATYVKARD